MPQANCQSHYQSTLLSLPPLIDMWGQSLDACCAAQEARRIEARAASNAASEAMIGQTVILLQWDKQVVHIELPTNEPKHQTLV
jgi:hypothetical protein